MNKRIGVLLATIMSLGIGVIIAAQVPTSLRAETPSEVQLFLPAVIGPFAPQLKPFVTDLAPPNIITDIVDPGDGRLFIATREGRIRISSPDGTVQPDLLLDIRDRVYDDGNEMGLVGLATHPDFTSNGFIYVHYTEMVEGVYYSVLARYLVGSNSQADPDTEQRILNFELPTARHHGGALQFGPLDGYLYIAVGDGGTGGDFAGNGQSTKTLLGKILRIDVNNGSPYAIPPDNPFTADEDSLDEIWALGLRNPWRISFDRETGDMYIGDVGEITWEEINFIPAGSSGGENFGWPCMEGPAIFRPDACDENATYSAPIFFYPHGPNGCGAVTAGFVYHGTRVPELKGHFLLGDLCVGKLWSLELDGEQGWIARDWGITNKNITTFGEGHDGELFIGAKNVYQIIGTGQPD